MFYLKGHHFGFPLIQRTGVMKHSGTYPIKWNAHSGAEIHFILKGNISWELKDRTEPLTVTGGNLAIIAPGCQHRGLGDVGTPSVRLGMILKKPYAGCTAGSSFSDEDYRKLHRLFQEKDGKVLHMSTRLLSFVRDFVENLTPRSVQSQEEQRHLRTIASAILDETCRVFTNENPLISDGAVIPQIVKWIDQHCCENIGPERLVKLSGYGRSRFFSLFFETTGMTPNDYIIRARIARAKTMLTESDARPVAEIARRCGFISPASFSTTFRKHAGVTPSDYKKEAAGPVRTAGHPSASQTSSETNSTRAFGFLPAT